MRVYMFPNFGNRTQVLNEVIDRILEREHICISTELKWRCAEYGFYHDETATVARQSPNVQSARLSAKKYPRLQRKLIYKSRTNPPSKSEISRKARAYDQIVQTQSKNPMSGMFAQAIVSLAFWRAGVDFEHIAASTSEPFNIDTHPTYYVHGRISEIDIPFFISRSRYGVDVKNKLEMQTPQSSVDQNIDIRRLVETWSSKGIRPIIASPLSSGGLKRELMAKGGRSYDYDRLILLEDQQTQKAFQILGMRRVEFMPRIYVDGILCDGKEFFNNVNKILDRGLQNLGDLVSRIRYDNPAFSTLVSKCKGLYVLLCLYNQMENTRKYGSRTGAMKRAVEYLIFQYVCAAHAPTPTDRLTAYVRSVKYLPATYPLSKLSTQQSQAIVSEAVTTLESVGVVSLSSNGVSTTFGQRPEEFLTISRTKIRSDFGF